MGDAGALSGWGSQASDGGRTDVETRGGLVTMAGPRTSVRVPGVLLWKNLLLLFTLVYYSHRTYSVIVGLGLVMLLFPVRIWWGKTVAVAEIFGKMQ